MGYFIGTEARQHETAIKAILKTYLKTVLDTAFSPVGVDVIFRDDEVDDQYGGRPFIGLTKVKVKTERWGRTIEGDYFPGTRYLWQFEAVAVANDFNGGLTGADNMLADELVYAVDSPEGYAALDSLKIEEAKIEAGQESFVEGGGRENPFTIYFTTHALPSFVVSSPLVLAEPITESPVDPQPDDVSPVVRTVPSRRHKRHTARKTPLKLSE